MKLAATFLLAIFATAFTTQANAVVLQSCQWRLDLVPSPTIAADLYWEPSDHLLYVYVDHFAHAVAPNGLESSFDGQGPIVNFPSRHNIIGIISIPVHGTYSVVGTGNLWWWTMINGHFHQFFDSNDAHACAGAGLL